MKIRTNSAALVSGTITATILSLGTAYAAECKNPEVLRFSMIPTEETTQELSLYTPMVNQLKAATGKNVEFFLPTSYASVVEAMLGGFVDVGTERAQRIGAFDPRSVGDIAVSDRRG